MPFPWLAGMRVTADRLNEHNPVFVLKGSDEERTSTSTPADDPNLTLNVADGVWRIEASLDYAGESGSGGLRVDWNLSGGATVHAIRRVQGPESGATDRNAQLMRSAVHGDTTDITYGNTATSSLRSYAREEITVEGPGTVTLRWAQITSSSSPTTLAAGSYLLAKRVA
ncbi:hypothetical protein [Nocardiopsis suaedae]|uniref:Lipocalin-like domain-containing protein n=1 Tax=Nocardiopsis suaedae TaxID=3018444 RepID=A0ABT4TM57_9ACTN|nr:hypothetical protein [Nocardiopsis suaedae]MDA2805696.1 hypothetical protein [Nocardiopsis suaedae]